MWARGTSFGRRHASCRNESIVGQPLSEIDGQLHPRMTVGALRSRCITSCLLDSCGGSDWKSSEAQLPQLSSRGKPMCCTDFPSLLPALTGSLRTPGISPSSIIAPRSTNSGLIHSCQGFLHDRPVCMLLLLCRFGRGLCRMPSLPPGYRILGKRSD